MVWFEDTVDSAVEAAEATLEWYVKFWSNEAAKDYAKAADAKDPS